TEPLLLRFFLTNITIFYQRDTQIPIPLRRGRADFREDWRSQDDIIGWANAAVRGGRLECETGFAGKRPAGKDFHRELEAEFDAMKAFLSLP
ncbi:MAG: hypothetical protein WC421_11325, partial [Elusimicrobiales bacterium]